MNGSTVEPSRQATLEECHGVDPSLCLATLVKMSKVENWGTKISNMAKRLPASYKEFNNLTAGQHITFKAVMLVMPLDIKEEMKRRSCTQNEPGNKKRAENTTKNDLVRLIELRIHSSVQRKWLNCFSPQDRSTLDANLASEETLSHPNMVYFNELAAVFNNRNLDDSNDFRPQNIVCEYASEVEKEYPLRNANPDLYSEEVFDILKDLNPMEVTAPIRDGEWIKDHMADLRLQLQVPYKRWSKSGNQRGDNTTQEGIDEFILNFGSTTKDPIKYMIIRYEKMFLDVIGRDMGEDGQDSGLIDDDQSCSQGQKRKVRGGKNGKEVFAKSLKRNEQRKRSRNARNSSRSDADDCSVTSTPSGTIDSDDDNDNDNESSMAASFKSFAQTMEDEEKRKKKEERINNLEKLMKYFSSDGTRPDAALYSQYEKEWLLLIADSA